MKRKLVQQGAATMMVSLPSKWIKKFGLKKGDEIDLEEKGSIINIYPELKKERNKIIIEINSWLPMIVVFQTD